MVRSYMNRTSLLAGIWKKEGLFIVVALLVLVLDQFTKFLVRANMYPGQSIPEEGILRLTYVTNTGSAFGLFQNQTLLLTIAAIIGVGFILYYYRRHSSPSVLLNVSMGLVAGGAIGNLADRIRLGFVVDFIDFRIWGDFHWPVFNVADSSINIGIFLLVGYLLFSREKKLPTETPGSG